MRKLIYMYLQRELATPVLGNAVLDLVKKKSAQADGKTPGAGGGGGWGT